ncbi:hypothetical protein [Streptomyces sp. NPDC086023]|uniref:hypothetical protein n=1 Tax=Streptomyces sp. NPDC086023 TaxID=3365746 RepID=UPI0037CEDE84
MQARGKWTGGGGASASLAGFLESWEAWLTASPPARVEPVTWTSVANQLAAARGYE